MNGNFNYRAPPQCYFSIAIKAEMKKFALREHPSGPLLHQHHLTGFHYHRPRRGGPKSNDNLIGPDIIGRNKAPSSTRSDGTASRDKDFVLSGLCLGLYTNVTSYYQAKSSHAEVWKIIEHAAAVFTTLSWPYQMQASAHTTWNPSPTLYVERPNRRRLEEDSTRYG